MTQLVTNTDKTHRVSIFIAGDLHTIKESCRQYCMEVPLCVTITPCDFVYQGGSESGVEIGLINYPRFPCGPAKLLEKAQNLTYKLIKDCNQRSASIVADKDTYWIHMEET